MYKTYVRVCARACVYTHTRARAQIRATRTFIVFYDDDGGGRSSGLTVVGTIQSAAKHAYNIT